MESIKETNLELLSLCASRHNANKIFLKSVRHNTDTKNLDTLLDALFKQYDTTASQIIELLNKRNKD